jgi:glycosyltransferase involved in cell wall biosynthesis
VVWSDLPAIRVVVTHVVDGLLVPSGDAAALAKSIERLLADDGLADDLAAAGRRAVLERFDVETNVDHLVGLLWPEQLAGQVAG